MLLLFKQTPSLGVEAQGSRLSSSSQFVAMFPSIMVRYEARDEAIPTVAWPSWFLLVCYDQSNAVVRGREQTREQDELGRTGRNGRFSGKDEAAGGIGIERERGKGGDGRRKILKDLSRSFGAPQLTNLGAVPARAECPVRIEQENRTQQLVVCRRSFEFARHRARAGYRKMGAGLPAEAGKIPRRYSRKDIERPRDYRNDRWNPWRNGKWSAR